MPRILQSWRFFLVNSHGLGPSRSLGAHQMRTLDCNQTENAGSGRMAVSQVARPCLNRQRYSNRYDASTSTVSTAHQMRTPTLAKSRLSMGTLRRRAASCAPKPRARFLPRVRSAHQMRTLDAGQVTTTRVGTLRQRTASGPKPHTRCLPRVRSVPCPSFFNPDSSSSSSSLVGPIASAGCASDAHPVPVAIASRRSGSWHDASCGHGLSSVVSVRIRCAPRRRPSHNSRVPRRLGCPNAYAF